MRAETELFKDKIEVSLDGRQIFYLFFGGAVIAALVFVLGVMVGKRVEARAHTDGRPATSAVMDPLAALDQLSQRDDLVFPSTLATGSAAPAQAQAAADDAPAAAAPEGKDEAASRSDDAKAAAPAAKPNDKSEGKSKPADQDKPARVRFTLQLSSFRDRAEADAFFTTIKQAGYEPYVVEAEVPGKGTWYRVRLGRYSSYDAAIEAKKEFEDSQKIIAYVTRLRRDSDG